MMRFRALVLVMATVLIPVFAAAREAPSNDEFAPLVLVRIIPMPVHGPARIMGRWGNTTLVRSSSRTRP